MTLGGCLLGLVVMSEPAAGQALEDLRRDVRTSDPGPGSANSDQPETTGSGSGNNSSSSTSSDPADDGWSVDELGAMTLGLGAAITAPFWGPPVVAGDGYMLPAHFLHFPYQYHQGYMLLGSLPQGGVPTWFDSYPVAVRARSEFGTDFDNLAWVGGQLIVETRARFGADSDFRYVTEKLSSGSRDSLWLGDANLLFRFAQGEYLIMRTGVGASFLADPARTDWGFNFTYGGDFFPIQPLVLSAELDIGTLGHTNLYHFRSTLGANWRHAEAYLGYDYLDIGPTQIAGLISGVRLWF
jgi:hypothetical protein